MPFKSEKQKKFLFANKPKLAKRWSKEYKKGAEVKKKPKMGYKEEGIVKEVDVAKNVKTIKVTDFDIKNMLNLANTIKSLRNDTADHCDVSYRNIQDLVHNMYLLTNIFNFKQPNCDNGHPNYYADFEIAENDNDME